ncbi:HD domain-containing protein, partial [bacterium]
KKEMRLVYLDKAFEYIAHKYKPEQVRRLAELYAQWQEPKKQREVRQILKDDFNIRDAEAWIRAMMDLWFYFNKPDKYKCTADEKVALLNQLNLTEDEFFTLSYLIKHINKVQTGYSTCSYLLNPPEMSASRLLSHEALCKLAEMIARIGDLCAQEKLAKGLEKWIDRRDIEFAIARCEEDDNSPYKVQLEHIYDLVTGKDLGPGWVKIVHTQNRPINPEKEAEDPEIISFKKKRVDKDYTEEHHLLPIGTKGLVGYGATEGILYFFDPYKTPAEQEEEIKEMQAKGINVIVVLEEMGPEHDPIVATAGGAIVWRGNDTSHAYIFSLEQRIPVVINPEVDERFKGYLEPGRKIVISGEDGEIWPGDKSIPLLDDDLKIRVDMLPTTKASLIVSTLQSAQEIARLGARSVLTRMEFLINQVVKIYPQAAYTYDLMLALDSGKIKLEELTPEELADIALLRESPSVIAKIKETVAGFATACEFMAEQMHYVSNALGVVFPLGNKMRAYDNKEKEALLYGLIGAKLFLKYDDRDPRYDAPLNGMRGSQLMIHPHLKKGFLWLNRGVVRSIKDGLRNNSFFFVYLRHPEELKIQLEDFAQLCQEEGAYPKEIGVMIEVGNNIWFIDEIYDILIDFLKAHKKDGMESVFISFGTNDLTHSLGLVPREDKDFTDQLKVLDPALIDVEPEAGKIEVEPGVTFGPKEKGKPYIITLNDEAAPVVIRFIEHVVARARAKSRERGEKIQVSLCGQAITKAINQGNIKVGIRLISCLDTFGTQSKTFTAGAMFDCTARTSLTEVAPDELEGKTPVARLSRIKEEIKEGALVGEAVIISGPADIVKLREGVSRDKIAIITGYLGTQKELDREDIPWDYLRYARAILVDSRLEEDKLGILNQDAVIRGQIQARVEISGDIASGQIITVNYANGSAYDGALTTTSKEVVLRELRMPQEGLTPATKRITRISSSDLFASRNHTRPAIDIHPLAFVLYRQDPGLVSAYVQSRIAEFIDGRDPLGYLEEVFTDYILRIAENAIAQGLVPVYTTFRLTRNTLRLLHEGEAIEITKGKEGKNFDDPMCRLQGGARNISDFWPIHRAELAAFKKAKERFPQLLLQLSTKGVRSCEVLEAELRVLKAMGIDRNEQEIGLELTTPADILYVEDYIKQGIKFFSYDSAELAAALLAANLHHPEIFKTEGKDRMVEWTLERPLAYVKGIVAENDSSGIWLGEKVERLPIARLAREKESEAERKWYDKLKNVLNEVFESETDRYGAKAQYGKVYRRNYGFIHAEEMWRLLEPKALELKEQLEAEGIILDMEVLIAICFLHDIGTAYTGSERHEYVLEEIIENILQAIEFPAEKRALVKAAIREHHDYSIEPGKRSSFASELLFWAETYQIFSPRAIEISIEVYKDRYWQHILACYPGDMRRQKQLLIDLMIDNMEQRAEAVHPSLVDKQFNDLCQENLDYLGKHGIEAVEKALPELAPSREHPAPVELPEPRVCPVAIGPELRARYEQFKPLELRVRFANGGTKILNPKVLNQARAQGVECNEEVIIRRLTEATESMPRSPPFVATILITKDTRQTYVREIEFGFIIMECVSDRESRRIVIKAQPLILESDEKLAQYLRVSTTQAQKFIVTCSRNVSGYANGLERKEGEEETLSWLCKSECAKSQYLQANLAVLDKANPNHVYPIGDCLKKLSGISDFLTQANRIRTAIIEKVRRKGVRVEDIQLNYREFLERKASNECAALNEILFDLTTSILSDWDQAETLSAALKDLILEKERLITDIATFPVEEWEEKVTIPLEHTTAFRAALNEIRNPDHDTANRGRDTMLGLGVCVIPNLQRRLSILLALPGAFDKRNAIEVANISTILKKFLYQNCAVDFYRKQGRQLDDVARLLEGFDLASDSDIVVLSGINKPLIKAQVAYRIFGDFYLKEPEQKGRYLIYHVSATQTVLRLSDSKVWSNP